MLTSPRAVRAMALVVSDAVGDCWVCGEAVPMSLGLCWLGVGHRMCLWGLEPRKQGSPVRHLDTLEHLSRCSQGQGSGSHRCPGVLFPYVISVSGLGLLSEAGGWRRVLFLSCPIHPGELS